MWKCSIVFLIQFHSLLSADIPQLQVLYYSSDPNLPWAPGSTPLSEIPGHKVEMLNA